MTAKDRKELQQLHDLYDKHEYIVLGRVPWGKYKDKVYTCTCLHAFWYDDERLNPGKKHLYDQDTCDEWVLASLECMPAKYRRPFRSYLRRHDWLPRDLKSAKRIFGDKLGKTMGLKNGWGTIL
jgi:hypothetical protein